MVIVPILTSLLLKWAFPRVGQAISGMLMAARGIGGNIQASTAGIVPASHDRMLGLEHNEMRDAMMDYGKRSLAMRKAFNDWDSLHTGVRMGRVLGEAPTLSSSAQLLGQSSLGFTLDHKYTAGMTEQAKAELTSAREQQATAQRVGAMQFLSSRTAGEITTDSLGRHLGLGADEQARISKNYSALKTAIRAEKAFDGLSNENVSALAVTVAGKTEFGIQGGVSTGKGPFNIKAGLNAAHKLAFGRQLLDQDSSKRTRGSEISDTDSTQTGTGVSKDQAFATNFGLNLNRGFQATAEDAARRGFTFTDAQQFMNSSNQRVSNAVARSTAASFASASTAGFSIKSTDLTGMDMLQSPAALRKIGETNAAVMNTLNSSGAAAAQKQVELQYSTLGNAAMRGDLNAAQQFVGLLGGIAAAYTAMGNHGQAERAMAAKGAFLHNFEVRDLAGGTFEDVQGLQRGLIERVGSVPGVTQHFSPNAPLGSGPAPLRGQAEALNNARTVADVGIAPAQLPNLSEIPSFSPGEIKYHVGRASD